ncbi:Crp/Fnr family transcriptional regulator [Maribacter halichondriae]|uniref:Crp/Fnr family transcriptional regulator n=1 Tax=Maribacter halichondriae TaxID=2980554 RepID=UPI00235832FA|nr:Crp/Fnr family transcriptional regulator [Maribacter sp. Hal144]
MVLVEFLKKAGVTMTEELQAFLLRSLKLVKYEKGDFFCEQGHVCQQLGFLVEGQAALRYLTDDNEFTRWVGLQFTFVTAFDSFINEVPNQYSISFLSDSTMEVFSKTEFDRLSNDFPEMRKFIYKALAHEVVKYQHLTDLLITTKGKERYLKFQERYPQMVNEVPQKYIASILGMNPRHLSRIRRQLVKGSK